MPSIDAASSLPQPMRRFTCQACGYECFITTLRHQEATGRCERCEDAECNVRRTLQCTPSGGMLESPGAATPPTATRTVPAPAPRSSSTCALQDGTLTRHHIAPHQSQDYVQCAHCMPGVLYFTPQLRSCHMCNAHVCYGCVPMHPCWRSPE